MSVVTVSATFVPRQHCEEGSMVFKYWLFDGQPAFVLCQLQYLKTTDKNIFDNRIIAPKPVRNISFYRCILRCTHKVLLKKCLTENYTKLNVYFLFALILFVILILYMSQFHSLYFSTFTKYIFNLIIHTL